MDALTADLNLIHSGNFPALWNSTRYEGRGIPPRLREPLKQTANQLAQWLPLLISPEQVVELRALQVQNGNYKPNTQAGFFHGTMLQTLATAALQNTRMARGIYFTLNPLHTHLLNRKTNRISFASTGEQAADKDVLHRQWLLIDADPIRDSHISATDDEKKYSYDLILQVREHLSNNGWPLPLLSDSGNGYHLLYRIEIPADDKGLIQSVLKKLAHRFDNEHVKLDQTVHNPSRICKVPGTWARKGDPSPTRPHRVATILEVPTSAIQTVPADLLHYLDGSSVKSIQLPEKANHVPRETKSQSSKYLKRLRVDDWLSNRNIPFTTKPEPDALGRTHYVLATCPFNSAHQAPDACIMQESSGKLSAKCFHNSCSAYGWNDFKRQIGTPERHHYDHPKADFKPTYNTPQSVSLPHIVGNHCQLHSVTQKALDALIKRNSPPALFNWSGQLARLRRTDQRHYPEMLTQDALRGLLARSANWFQLKNTKEGDIEEEAPPQMEVVKDLASLPEWEGIPQLKSILTTPFLRIDGEVITQSGYDEPSACYLSLPDKIVIDRIPSSPTETDVTQAKQLLLEELLGDFPFVDEASRTHTLAALLLPFVRQFIHGPTPLHFIDAPTEGTGKTLLAELLSIIITGNPVTVQPAPKEEDEWRKCITSILIESPMLVLFDNVKYTLESPGLAAALSASIWSDRLLKNSKRVHVPIYNLWLATGNNGTVSPEISRRTIWIQLDSKLAQPSARSGFRHPNIIRWALKERWRLVHACLTLLRYWYRQGSALGNSTMGKYESWAEVMSGIMQCIHLTDFLSNAKRLREMRIQASDEWPSFVLCWFKQYGHNVVGTDSLYELAVKNNLLDSVLGDNGPRSQRTRLGIALRSQTNRDIDGLIIQILPEPDNRKRQQFQLVKLIQD